MDRDEVVVVGDLSPAVFHSPHRDESGAVDLYSIRLEGPDIVASLPVDSISFHEGVTAFFQDLDANWRGWQGRKTWQSYAGELALEATCDSQGHISLEFAGSSRVFQAPWRATLTVVLEAGQLQALVGQLAQFFRNEP